MPTDFGYYHLLTVKDGEFQRTVEMIKSFDNPVRIHHDQKTYWYDLPTFRHLREFKRWAAVTFDGKLVGRYPSYTIERND